MKADEVVDDVFEPNPNGFESLDGLLVEAPKLKLGLDVLFWFVDPNILVLVVGLGVEPNTGVVVVSAGLLNELKSPESVAVDGVELLLLELVKPNLKRVDELVLVEPNCESPFEVSAGLLVADDDDEPNEKVDGPSAGLIDVELNPKPVVLLDEAPKENGVGLEGSFVEVWLVEPNKNAGFEASDEVDCD